MRYVWKYQNGTSINLHAKDELDSSKHFSQLKPHTLMGNSFKDTEYSRQSADGIMKDSVFWILEPSDFRIRFNPTWK